MLPVCLLIASQPIKSLGRSAVIVMTFIDRERLEQSLAGPFGNSRQRHRTMAMSLLLAHDFSDMFGNVRQINFGKIGKSDEREFLFDIPCKDRFETPK